jgi:hypothetical protein
LAWPYFLRFHEFGAQNSMVFTTNNVVVLPVFGEAARRGIVYGGGGISAPGHQTIALRTPAVLLAVPVIAGEKWLTVHGQQAIGPLLLAP